MSETLHHPEHHHKPVEHEAEPAVEARAERHHTKHESAPETESLDAIRERIEKHVIQQETGARQAESNQDTPAAPYFMKRELQAEGLKRTLARARARLSKPEQRLSKVIHQPVVDKVSELGARTVARPSGFLLGSFLAFLGSLSLLYTAKHYGFRYNYLTFIFLFVGGYVLGVLIELSWRLLRRNR